MNSLEKKFAWWDWRQEETIPGALFYLLAIRLEGTKR